MRRLARLVVSCSLSLVAAGVLADPGRLAAMAEAADRRDAEAAVWAEALASPDPTLQLQAVRDLGRIGGATVLARLLPLLAHEAAAVRQETAFALAIAGLEPDGLAAAEQALLARLAVEPDAVVRAVLLRALGNVGAEPTQTLLRDYLKTAAMEQPEERTAWAQAAGFLWSYRRGALTAVEPALVQQLLRWTTVDQPVAEMAAFALARARKEPIIPPQAAALKAAFGSSPSASARIFLLRALATSIAADSAFWLTVQHSRRLAGRALSGAEVIELQTQLGANLTGQPLRSAVASALRQANAGERWAALQSLSSRPADIEPLRDLLQAHANLTPTDRDWLAPLLQPPVGAEPDTGVSPEASEPPAPTLPYSEALTAVGKRYRLHTVRGSIDIELLPAAVYSAANFARLADRGYYNGTVFHRVIGNFVAQGGDPTGTGEGGPGWRIREELSQLPQAPGYVGMATAGKDTAGSQFFINTGRNPHLDWHYTVFARLLNGQDIALQLLPGDRLLAVTRLP